MASPNECKVLDIDGLEFTVEVWRDPIERDRVLCKGPAPAVILFYSFERPKDSRGSTSWNMIQTILSRRVNEYIKESPNQWKRFWGEDGVFAKTGDKF